MQPEEVAVLATVSEAVKLKERLERHVHQHFKRIRLRGLKEPQRLHSIVALAILELARSMDDDVKRLGPLGQMIALALIAPEKFAEILDLPADGNDQLYAEVCNHLRARLAAPQSTRVQGESLPGDTTLVSPTGYRPSPVPHLRL